MMDIAQTAPETIILAEDEASLYLQATTTTVWAPRGQTPVVSVQPARDRVSFYGTLNLHSGQEVTTQEPTMNSEATARHLNQVLATYPEVPILLLWDRASWHGGEAVRALLAANPRLEVMRFPTAAPDLNPQEMVWKATRKAISHNHDERQLASLGDRFEQHLKTTTFCYSMLEKYDHDRICAMFK
jgi:transposase